VHLESQPENAALRTALRDLVALSTMPAAWAGREAHTIAAGLADVLVGSLQLDFAFVRLCDRNGGRAIEVMRGHPWTAFPEWLHTHSGFGQYDVGGDDARHAVVIPLGIDGHAGLVVGASGRSDYPNEIDRLLLSVAANHAAAAFQNAPKFHEHDAKRDERERGLLDRERLRDLFHEAVTRQVTVVCAPPGSGKTSLLRTWIERARDTYRIVYVSARSEDDEQGFWLTMLAQLRSAPGTPTPVFSGPAMVNRVLSELGAENTPTALIVDDAHELGQGALANLTTLLGRLAAHVHVVIATRRDLRLGVHQLRVAGQLAEIRADKLAFTEPETRALLAISGITLSDDAVRTLQLRTEGWAAGLRLAVLSLAVESDPETFVAQFSGTNRVVAEYLMAEMLERQPADVQRVLLTTSILDHVNGELADLLSETSGSDRIFLGLEEVNAFVVSVDSERRWFRYHHLFRELLRLELRRTMPSSIPELHRRAAAWFSEHGQIIEAIRHRQAASDWELAAHLLADNLFDLLLNGHDATIRALLEAFPRGECTQHPELALVNAALALQQGRFADTATDLDVAERHAQTLPAQRQPAFRVGIATLRLGLARRQGQLDSVVDQVTYLASPEAARLISGTAFNAVLRTVALMNLGVVEMWSGRMADAEQHLREGAALARKIGQPYLEISCLSNLAFVLKLGSFAAAREHSESTIALAERYGWANEPIVVPALEAIGGTLVCTGQFSAGEPWLARAMNLLGPDANPPVQLLVHMAKGMLFASRGQLREALTEFESAERMQSLMLGEHLFGAQAGAWTIATKARLGMLDEARAALAATPPARADTAELRNADALISLLSGDPGLALEKLREILEGRLPIKHDLMLIEAHLLAAQAYHALGQERDSQAATEHALALAERDRLISPFAMTGANELLERHPRQSTAHAALLLDILDILTGSAPLAGSAIVPLNELSHTELRVLRFLPTNLSRPDIARELGVSVNTVNTHMRNIYSKLDAGNRTEAVDRARGLRLLAH
jgi:LuxR family transcriptional regulator, maltose regulon positive regulatory protein